MKKKSILLSSFAAVVLCACSTGTSVPSLKEAAGHDDQWLSEKLQGNTEEKIISVWQEPDYRMASPEETILYFHYDEPEVRFVLTMNNGRFDSAIVESGEEIRDEYAGDAYCEAAVYFIADETEGYYIPVLCIHKKLTDYSIQLEDTNRKWFFDLVYEYGEAFSADHQALQKKFSDHLIGNLIDFEDYRVSKENLDVMADKVRHTKITVYLIKDDTSVIDTYDYIFTMAPRVVVEDRN